jgi:putative transposase
MQSLVRRYVQYVNLKYRRSGTLWEGRHKASLVEQETYLLVCYRYIELNMVTKPADYKWSSFRRLDSTMADRYLGLIDIGRIENCLV